MSAEAGEVHFGIAQADPMDGKARNCFKTPSRAGHERQDGCIV